MKRFFFIGVYLFFSIALFAQKTEISTSQIVDLGLSVKWAGWNVGATSPEEYGGLYGWADPSGKKVSGNKNEYPSENPPINICGTKYDIAHAQWGDDWRLPTIEEMEELMNKCKWKWISYRKTNGYKVTGPNGQSIFLPAGGVRSGSLGNKILQVGRVYNKSQEGHYMTGSSYSKTHSIPFLYFHSGRYGDATDGRSTGYSVRPVMGTSNFLEKKNQKESTQSNIQSIKFDSEEIFYNVNYDELMTNDTLSCTFSFINNSTNDFIINKVVIVPNYVAQYTPITLPGQIGNITIKRETRSLRRSFVPYEKVFVVRSNMSPIKLRFKIGCSKDALEKLSLTNHRAKIVLAETYYKGTDKYIQLLKEIATDSVDPKEPHVLGEARHFLGIYYEGKGNISKAIYWYEKALEAGYGIATIETEYGEKEESLNIDGQLLKTRIDILKKK